MIFKILLLFRNYNVLLCSNSMFNNSNSESQIGILKFIFVLKVKNESFTHTKKHAKQISGCASKTEFCTCV